MDPSTLPSIIRSSLLMMRPSTRRALPTHAATRRSVKPDPVSDAISPCVSADHFQAPTPEVQLPRNTLRHYAPWKLALGSWRLIRGGSPLERDLRYAPVADLRRPELVRVAAVELVDAAEFLRQVAGAAEAAEYLAGEIELVDLAIGIDILGRVRVRGVQDLLRARRDADRARRPDVGDLALEVAVAVEHLDALVARVGNID